MNIQQFSLQPSDDVYIVRSEVVSIEDNPFILIKLSNQSDMSQYSFYMANYVNEDSFVLLNIDDQEVELKEEYNPTHMCKHCNSQGDTKDVSGFKIHNKRVNVISDQTDSPTEAKRNTIHLCNSCIEEINTEYQIAITGEEENLLSHII